MNGNEKEFKRIEVTDPAHADVLNEKIVEPAIELVQKANKNAEDIAAVDQKVNEHLADNTPHRELLQVRRLNKDENGVFTTIEYDRLDGTLFKRTTLSGGESPNYTTRTVEFFDTDGETIVQTEVFNIIYDDDGDFLREEKVNA